MARGSLKRGQRGFYMVSIGGIDGLSRYALSYSLKLADKTARAAGGTVHAMPLPPASERTWDAPTFRVCSEMIRDYRSR